MSQENLALCKELIDQGAHAEAWVVLARLLSQNTEGIKASDPVVAEALAAYQANYVDVRNQLRRMIQNTGSASQVSACLTVMGFCRDYAGLASCRDLEVKIDDSIYFMDFRDYVDGHLFRSKFADASVALTPTLIEGARANRGVFSPGNFMFVRREASDVTTPLYDGAKRLEMGTQVWAADFDPATGRYIMALSQEDRVVGVNVHTGETEAILESPLPGIRGICVLPNLRRGFFVSEFGNQMISFDLDGFEIRKQIKGFSVRPERIRVDAATNTMVTGNLGWGLMQPCRNEPEIWRSKCSDEGKATDGESITIVDANAESVTRTITTGRRPTAVAISDTHIVAGNFHDNTLTIYERNDLSVPVVVSLDVLSDTRFDIQLDDAYEGRSVVIYKKARARVVEGIAIVDRRGWVLVAGWDACILTVVDIQARKVVKVIPVQNGPFDVVVDGGGRYAYVSCHGSAQVSVVDLDRGCEVCRLQTGSDPMDLRLVGGTLLIGDNAGLNIFDLNELSHEGLMAPGGG